MLSRRNFLISIVVLAAIAGAAYVWRSQQILAAEREALANLRQEVVGRGTIVAFVSATGPLQAESQVSLFFDAASPAPVTAVYVELGDKVTLGQLLAELENSDLRLAVTQAEQALRSAELNLAQITAPPRPEDIAVAEANLKLAQAQVFQASQGLAEEAVEVARLNLVLARRALDQLHERMQSLVDSGRYADKAALEGQEAQLIENAQIAELRYEQALEPPSPGRAGTALATVDQAQIALDRLRRGAVPEDVQIARLQVEQARASLELAQSNLRDAQITAPFDGVVAAVNVRVGEPAGSSVPALVLVDVNPYHLDVSVDEVDVGRIAANQPVTVTLDALPDIQLAGRVERIAPQSTTTAGIVGFPVRIVFLATDARLRAGMTSTADITVEAARDVVLVPNWAVRRDRESGRTYASLLRGGRLEEVEVSLGLRNDAFSQVLSGVAAGDIVAVSTAREGFSLFGP